MPAEMPSMVVDTEWLEGRGVWSAYVEAEEGQSFKVCYDVRRKSPYRASRLRVKKLDLCVQLLVEGEQ